MNVDSRSIVSINEASRDFSKVARLVDENGMAVILKNDVPRYIVIDISEAEVTRDAADGDVMRISDSLLKQNLEAYRELAK